MKEITYHWAPQGKEQLFLKTVGGASVPTRLQDLGSGFAVTDRKVLSRVYKELAMKLVLDLTRPSSCTPELS